MPIMAMTIDTGFRPQMVYEFAARHPQPAHGPAGDAIAAPRTVVATKGTARLFETDRVGVADGRVAQAAERPDLAHWHALGEAGVLRLAADRAARRWHVPTRLPALRLQGSGLLSRALLRVADHPCRAARWSGCRTNRSGTNHSISRCSAARLRRSVASIVSRRRSGRKLEGTARRPPPRPQHR